MAGKIVKWVLLLAAVAAIALALWYPQVYANLMGLFGAGSGRNGPELALHTVRKGTLVIRVVEEGTLRAVKNHEIKPAFTSRGSVKIAWLIPEGATVAKGQKVVEFENTPILDSIKTAETDLANARKQEEIDRESITIQQSENKSAIFIAEAAVKDADENLADFDGKDAPARVKTLREAINDARQQLTDAQSKLMEAVRNASEGVLVDEEKQKEQLESQILSAKAAVENAQDQVTNALLAKKLYMRDNYRKTREDLSRNCDDARRALEKVKVQAKSSLQQKEVALAQTQDKVSRVEKQLGLLKEQLTQCVVDSPADGIVLYGAPSGTMTVMYGASNTIAVGGDVWPGQTILTIPDLSAFEIPVSIGEEYRGRLKTPCQAEVTIEAIPGLDLQGQLKSISSLARPRVSWDASSPKAFEGLIELKNSDQRMVSGMTARVEITAETVENALFVPVEAVLNADGKCICHVRKDGRLVPREVVCGKSNDDCVVIVSGLSEGEQVALYPPTGGGQAAGGEAESKTPASPRDGSGGNGS